MSSLHVRKYGITALIHIFLFIFAFQLFILQQMHKRLTYTWICDLSFQVLIYFKNKSVSWHETCGTQLKNVMLSTMIHLVCVSRALFLFYVPCENIQGFSVCDDDM